LRSVPRVTRVDLVYGIHLWSYAALGEVCCEEGPVMAACDKFTIRVHGQGTVQLRRVPLDAIVEAVTSLQTLTSIWIPLTQRSAA